MDDTQQLVIFEGEAGRVEVRLEGETVWLSQAHMAELFDKDVRTVNEHIQNVYQEGELEQEATIRKFRIVRQEGQRQVQRDIAHYNLDVIISVGYRVKSKQGTRLAAVESAHLLRAMAKPEHLAIAQQTLQEHR